MRARATAQQAHEEPVEEMKDDDIRDEKRSSSSSSGGDDASAMPWEDALLLVACGNGSGLHPPALPAGLDLLCICDYLFICCVCYVYLVLLW